MDVGTFTIFILQPTVELGQRNLESVSFRKIVEIYIHQAPDVYLNQKTVEIIRKLELQSQVGIGCEGEAVESNSWMVVGRQMRERGEPDQAESASKELTAFVGLYKSHHTWLVSCSHAVSFERHPIAAPYFPNPQQALFTSSNPATSKFLRIL